MALSAADSVLTSCMPCMGVKAMELAVPLMFDSDVTVPKAAAGPAVCPPVRFKRACVFCDRRLASLASFCTTFNTPEPLVPIIPMPSPVYSSTRSSDKHAHTIATDSIQRRVSSRTRLESDDSLLTRSLLLPLLSLLSLS